MQRWRTPLLIGAILLGFTLAASARPAAIGNDFNGDGQADVLWRHGPTGQLYAWLMNGNSVQSAVAFTPSGLSDPSWRLAGIADFDRDGDQDLLWHHQTTGELYVWFLGGGADDRRIEADTLSASTSVDSGAYLTPSAFTDVNWQIRATEDFNGDGLTDLLWHHRTSGKLYVWYLGYAVGPADRAGLVISAPATTVVAGAFLSPSAMTDTNWQIRGSADFNDDGAVDLLWHHRTTGSLYVWYLSSPGLRDVATTSEPATGPTVIGGTYLSPSAMSDTAWQIQQLSDLNGDLHADILWRNTATGDLYVWYLGSAVTDVKDVRSGIGPSGYCTVTGGASLSPSAMTDPNWQILPR